MLNPLVQKNIFGQNLYSVNLLFFVVILQVYISDHFKGKPGYLYSLLLLVCFSLNLLHVFLFRNRFV